jgi:hypothetical protein
VLQTTSIYTLVNIKFIFGFITFLPYTLSVKKLFCAVPFNREINIGGSFAKFVDVPYYTESELCGGAVTVSFSKYLLWQAMHFLQRSTHFWKTGCRLLITSKFLASELPFHGWKSPEIVWGMFYWGSTDPLFPSRTQNSIHISQSFDLWLFQTMKRSSEARKPPVPLSS